MASERFQYFVIAVGGLAYVADSMEIMVLSFLGPIMKCKYHITPEEESVMATVRLRWYVPRCSRMRCPER